ncbi:hypothetical protein DPSP01_011982 [Paraphaeosphaeria sporulosa]|uniref:amidase n=1 Tax=Paraphaeosphaeria sporulosa TaxID=1460663 RepID=A0A177CWD0_9PLEO|nr:amidase [Paraphaeosphaeria sporulosa]OAG11202.1 amidase [Paraphaeosphaeria sporulosa]
MTAPWNELATAHRANQRACINKDWLLSPELLAQIAGTGQSDEGDLIARRAVDKSGLLTDKEIEITERYSVRGLLEEMATGMMSAFEVTQAFCKRAALAQQLTSCLTEIFFDTGLQRAKELDAYFSKHKKTKGPLHGLPISLKESFQVEGQFGTLGFVKGIAAGPASSNSDVVRLLLDAGAVLYCKTNIPQTMMTADSENNIFGRTLNPHKTTLTAGGSSGGEGALVAFRGSILGVGTDIAGSIRIPSLCCGIYGFKPSINRIPYGGQAPFPYPMLRVPGGIAPAAGPLAHSVEDLELFMRTVIGTENLNASRYDPQSLPLVWRDLETVGEKKQLTIGLLAEDPEYPLQPPVRRAFQEAALRLTHAGHRLVVLPHNATSSGAGLGGRLSFQYYAILPPGPDVKPLDEILGEPLVASVAKGVHPFTGGFPVNPALDLPQRLHELTEARDAYTAAWHGIWQAHALDVVLAPGAATTAVPHDSYGVPVYTCMWNLIDYPAGIIPFGKSSRELDPQPQKAVGPFEPHYDPDACEGAPCAVQVVAPRLQDEECLRAMRIIDKVLNDPSSFTPPIPPQ